MSARTRNTGTGHTRKLREAGVRGIPSAMVAPVARFRDGIERGPDGHYRPAITLVPLTENPNRGRRHLRVKFTLYRD